ncbi:uncharacterized protein LOC109809818 [Cajanus cajan]|uniref:uncharacterized protein LOC109809803 n=1 Tax=Cajanus cajan TaxID=3821 RepID=UPI00098D7EAC|nr:uncharacterized protein LOC109809803 [Cajanus cajan]XP_020228807.1 uncharacterized protein LOC109809818 [Cajanus cajan]
MAPSADLRKIGLEGFALIDKVCFPPRRSNGNANDAFQGRRERTWVVHHVPNGVMEDSAEIGKEVHFAGISAVSYPKGKPQNRWGRPIKF